MADSAAEAPGFALVTGSTSGLGRVLAHSLAVSGVSVGLVSRSPESGARTASAIGAASGRERVEAFTGDLASMASVREVAAAVLASHERIDVLVHCAAVYTHDRQLSADGLETMFATNVLGPHLLTSLLRDAVVAAPAARVLVFSAPSSVKVDIADLQSERRFGSLRAFGMSKTEDLMFTFELSRRLADTRVTANAVHPGLARTRLMRQAVAPLRWATWLASKPPEKAVETIAPLVLSPRYAGQTGQFFHKGKPIEPPRAALDEAVAGQLWDACDALSATG